MARSLPDYSNPPVIEVVCGVGFTPLPAFKVVHLGLLWELFKKEFPTIEEHAPVVMPLEPTAGMPAQPMMAQLEFVDVPPAPRVFFLDQTGNGIVQIQRDAFMHNWRKLKAEDQYPRFNSVFSGFKDYFGRLTKFAADSGLGAISPAQYELTYVNHIQSGEYWRPGRSLGALFPDFQWRDGERFFANGYDGINWKTIVGLPDGKGRLHISMQSGTKRADSSPLIMLEMKARGVARSDAREAMWEWFELAHEWIVRGFSDLTHVEAQEKLWGRKA